MNRPYLRKYTTYTKIKVVQNRLPHLFSEKNQQQSLVFHRTPNNPAPTGNGAECEGPSSETVSCQRDECPAACFQGNSSYTIGQLVSSDECTECYCRENIGIVCNEKEDAISKILTCASVVTFWFRIKILICCLYVTNDLGAIMSYSKGCIPLIMQNGHSMKLW